MLCLFGHVLFAKVSVSVSNFGPLQFKTGPLLYCCSLPTYYVASMYYCLLNGAPPRALPHARDDPSSTGATQFRVTQGTLNFKLGILKLQLGRPNSAHTAAYLWIMGDLI